jgi:hypothetical protein
MQGGPTHLHGDSGATIIQVVPSNQRQVLHAVTAFRLMTTTGATPTPTGTHRMYISKCVKKSASSRVVMGSKAPMAPVTVPYTSTSVPPGKLAFFKDVTKSPTW